MAIDRVALVTGANKGVGKQVARELVAGGLKVYVGSRDVVRGQAAAAEIGDGAVAVQLDVTDSASIASAAERIGAEVGRLDVLVSNAGISHAEGDGFTMEQYAAMSKPSSAPINEMRAVWEVNVFGALSVYQAML